MTVASAPSPYAFPRIAKGLATAAAFIAVLGFSGALQAAENRVATLIVIPPANLPLAPAPVTVAEIPPLAARRDPLFSRLEVLRDPQGSGTAIYGALRGETESATGALLTMLARTGPFDVAPVSQLLLADQSDRHAQAAFTAVLRGAPVVGVAIAKIDEPDGDIAIVYDDADAFAASFLRLQPALAPSAAVEIGISDNSAYEADAAAGANADANWDRIIAALSKKGEVPIDAALVHSLRDRLANDTGAPWQIVQPASFR